jgi:hypothetical protein
MIDEANALQQLDELVLAELTERFKVTSGWLAHEMDLQTLAVAGSLRRLVRIQLVREDPSGLWFAATTDLSQLYLQPTHDNQ